MNSCHGAFTKSLAPIDSLSASLLQTFCKNSGREGSLLATLHLTSKNGGFYLPFSASNCLIRCRTLLGESPPCAHMGFYQQLYHLSVASGGSTPPTEFWSWISSTLTLDGFHCPLRMTNWVSLRNFSLFSCHGVDLPSELLYLFACKFSATSCMAYSWFVFSTCIFPIDTCLCATCVLEFDGSTSESPLPLLNTCAHSTFSIDASLIMSTCILSFDTCLLAICERGLDDSSHVSPLHLPITCTHSTFSTFACCLFDTCCVLIFATCLDAHCALGLDDSIHKSPLPTACTSSTLAFAIVLLLLLSDLSVTESLADSTLIWLFSSLVLLAAMLWHDALATVKGRQTLYHFVTGFAYVIYALHLPPHMYGMESSPLPTPMTGDLARKSSRDSTLPLRLVWAFTLLTLWLWHFALALLHDITVNHICITYKSSLASMSCMLATCREQIGMMVLCCQFTFHISLDDIDSSLDIEQSIQATCISPRL